MTARPPGRGGGSARIAAMFLAFLGVIAVFADLLASDLPVAARYDGRLYVAPAWTGEGGLRGLDNATLAARLDPARGDWMLPPPIPFGPLRVDLSPEALPAPPGKGHLLGTDEVGRDVAARLIHGARNSLGVALAAAAIYLLLGVVLGALAGYFGGAVDAVIARVIEVLVAFPVVVLVLALLALVERPGTTTLVLVLGLTRWPDAARLMRAEVLRVKQLDFVLAARALGAGPLRLLLRHLLPNAVGPVLVAAGFELAYLVLLESGLSFLGLGIPAPLPSWGEMLGQAQRTLVSPGAWWLAVFPGAALFGLVMSCNRLVDSLRSALDPRSASRGVAGFDALAHPAQAPAIDAKRRASALDGNRATG